ncbi:MAG: metallophosphoesterase [Bacteroidota bacterium]
MLEYKIAVALSIIIFVLLMDIYSWQGVKTFLRHKTAAIINRAKRVHFGFGVLAVILFVSTIFIPALQNSHYFRTYVSAALVIVYISKLILCIFLLVDDLQQLFRWLARKAAPAKKQPSELPTMTRSKFLATTGTLASGIPLIVLTKGIFKGAYQYKIHRVPLYLKNLPLAFEGLRVGQLSDIHTGSLLDKDSVHKGIQMLMQEKTDVIFFTGDLVNNRTDEAYQLMDHFSEVKAPMGVFSIFGNHDYGDYTRWPSVEAKEQNLKDLVAVHKDMGWNLMRNDHVMLEKGSERIALIGVENWGDKGRFQKFGDLDMAMDKMPDAPVKLLLSHDPSHFDKIVTQQPQYKDIQATFSGHTHGFQFGIENAFIKWSPSQYLYPHWAGLYKEGNQQIYVNRGYGFLGYPGRVGILPEITIFELRRA